MNHTAGKLKTIKHAAAPDARASCAAWDDQTLLAALLAGTSSAPEQHGDCTAQAEELWQRHSSWRDLLQASMKAPRDDAVLSHVRLVQEVQRRSAEETVQRGTALTSPADTVAYLQQALRDRRREVFRCLFLDTRHRVIRNRELFQGSIDGACVYPRVVAEQALRYNAAAVIVAHNHPSGVTEPSLADQAITRRLKEALALFEIRLLDHFVIGDGPAVSMATRGML